MHKIVENHFALGVLQPNSQILGQWSRSLVRGGLNAAYTAFLWFLRAQVATVRELNWKNWTFWTERRHPTPFTELNWTPSTRDAGELNCTFHFTILNGIGQLAPLQIKQACPKSHTRTEAYFQPQLLFFPLFSTGGRSRRSVKVTPTKNWKLTGFRPLLFKQTPNSHSKIVFIKFWKISMLKSGGDNPVQPWNLRGWYPPRPPWWRPCMGAFLFHAPDHGCIGGELRVLRVCEHPLIFKSTLSKQCKTCIVAWTTYVSNRKSTPWDFDNSPPLHGCRFE